MQGVTAMVAVPEGAHCDNCQACLRLSTCHALLWAASDRLILIDLWARNGCGTSVTACPIQATSPVARAR